MFQVYKTFTRPDGLKEQRKFRGKTLEEAERKRDRAIWEYEQGLLCYNDKTTIATYASQWALNKRRYIPAAKTCDCQYWRTYGQGCKTFTY